MRRIVLCFVAVFVVMATAMASKPVKIIFDTDMGNDVDDVIALDMLYKYADMGKVDLLGVVSSKRELGSVRLIDVMGTIYGHPDVPLGIVKTYTTEDYKSADKRLNYGDYVVSKHDYPHSVKDYDALPDGYKLLRKLLAQNEDVVIVAVGFSTNLSRLLQSGPDEYSILDGKKLVAKSVKRLVMMAGNFDVRKKEYNIYNDRRSATRVLMEWPTEIFFSDFELGYQVMLPYTALLDAYCYALPHPALEAFAYYNKLPYNRPMWDATAVLYAVEPSSRYFSLSKRGYVTVSEGSVTYFYPDSRYDRRIYRTSPRQKMNTMRRISELIKIRPVPWR